MSLHISSLMADSSDDDRPIAQIALTKINQSSSSGRPATAASAASRPVTTARPVTAAERPSIIRTAPAAKVRPINSVSEKSITKASKESSAVVADIAGDEDDVPLAQLMAKRKLDSSIQRTAPPSLKKVKTEPKSESRDHGRNLREPKSKKKSKGKVKDKKTAQRSVVVTNTAANKTIGCYESDKGKIVQAILVRWWYALSWPEPGSTSSAPPGHEALDGYPGVFVGTRVQ